MSTKIGAIILAAGQSSRMGRNKLLEPVAGKAMVRHVAEAAMASGADPVVVVTGNESEKIRAELSSLPLTFQENIEFPMGLSSSLKCGLRALPDGCDGALILLADMPGIDAGLLRRMIAAFAPDEDRAILVATHQGQRGNPVLWARRYFAPMQALTGDRGAQSLMALHPGQVHEIEAGGNAPLVDIDTPQALAAWREAGHRRP